jgi:multiple sugar transport system substrate-binding protein
MRKLKNILIMCLLLCSAFLLFNSNPDIWSEAKKTILTIWSYTEEIKDFAANFEKQHRGIKLKLIIIEIEEYLSKLKSTFASGEDIPDIFLAEYFHIKEVVESGYWDDLAKEPYNADVSDTAPCIVEVGTDSSGKLRGLSWQVNVGGIYYRRSVASKYLGSHDPEKVGQMLSTPEKFLETARTLKKNSGGKVKLIGDYSEYNVFAFAKRKKTFISGSKLGIEQPILDYFDMAKTMTDEGLTAGIDEWSNPWFENMDKKEPDFMCYVLPTWGLHYVIKPNAEDTVGDWGLCKGPASYFWGGSWLGVCSKSKNKKAAWEFLKFVTLERETAEWYAKKRGDFVSNKAVVDKIKNDFSHELLSGQNYYTFFAEEAPKIDGSLLQLHDITVRGYMMDAVNEYAKGNMTREEAINKWKKDVNDYLKEYIAWKNPNAGKKEGAYGDFAETAYEETEEGIITLSVWSFTDEVEKYIDEFEKRNPDIQIDLTLVPCEEYLNKIRPVLRSGRNAPDLFTAEYANIVDLLESGFYDDLSAAPYKADVKDVLPFITEVGTDSRGRLRALSWQACVGGIFYRRSVAQKYLGTDDPEKISRMLSTPDKFLDTARKLNEKSNGRVKLIAGYGDYQQIAFALRKRSFVTDGKVNIEQCMLDYFDLAKIMADEKLTAGIHTWTPPWFENMNKSEPEFMCYVLPTWGLYYVIKPNGRDTVGDWGLCEGPAAYFWGGTWIGIYKNSENKEMAWKFLKFMTLERNSLEWWAKETGDFVGNKAAISKIKNDFADPLLAGQNHYALYAQIADKVDGSLLKKYDLDIRGFLMEAINDYVEGKVTKQEALDRFKSDVKNVFPELIVE